MNNTTAEQQDNFRKKIEAEINRESAEIYTDDWQTAAVRSLRSKTEAMNVGLAYGRTFATRSCITLLTKAAEGFWFTEAQKYSNLYANGLNERDLLLSQLEKTHEIFSSNNYRKALEPETLDSVIRTNKKIREILTERDARSTRI